MAEYLYDDDVYKPPAAQVAPRTLLDFVEALAPIAKYYVVLLFFWYLAKRFNAAVEQEADAQDKERQRPTLSKELVDTSSDEEEESEGEEEIYEELVTDGARLVSVPGAESEETTVRSRKPGKAEKKSSNKSHPLFEGLKKVEEEMRQKREQEKDEQSVSWNELHKGMLKRYQQKYPDHGLRTADGDDYDDEFKELLKKHNVDLEEIKKQQ